MSGASKSYDIAKEKYAKFGVNADTAINILKGVPLSINCWQGDDLSGFEKKDSSLGGGGILATGNYPGKPKNINEFRKDAEKALSLIPGKKKLALEAIYGDFGGNFDTEG